MVSSKLVGRYTAEAASADERLDCQYRAWVALQEELTRVFLTLFELRRATYPSLYSEDLLVLEGILLRVKRTWSMRAKACENHRPPLQRER